MQQQSSAQPQPTSNPPEAENSSSGRTHMSFMTGLPLMLHFATSLVSELSNPPPSATSQVPLRPGVATSAQVRPSQPQGNMATEEDLGTMGRLLQAIGSITYQYFR